MAREESPFVSCSGSQKCFCAVFRLFFLFFIFCSLLCSSFSLSLVSSSPTAAFEAAGNEKSVEVALQASWSDTPLVQEALEWAARGGAGEASLRIFPSSSSDRSSTRILDGFFFLEELWNSATLTAPRPLRKWTPEEQFSLVQKVVRTFLSRSTFISASDASRTRSLPDDSALLSSSAKAKLARFEVEMAARVYSPAVEAHYAIAAAAISSLSPASLSDTDVSKTSFSCVENDPFVFLYAPSHSTPIRLTSFTELLPVHKDFVFPLEKKGEKSQRGMEKWRSEMWLGDDAAGSSFLHVYPSSPSLADADAVIVLFGAPLEISTFRWYESIIKWLRTVTNSLQTPEKEKEDLVHYPPISSSFRVRFLFGHLPLSAEKRCRVVFQNSERKRRILSFYSGKPDALWTLSSSSKSWWEIPLNVQGYGVEVNLLSLPWANKKSEHYEEDRTEAIQEKKGEIRGFMISKLSSRYPSLSALLHFFATELDSTTTSTPLPVNEKSDSSFHHFGVSMLLYLSVRNQAEVAKLRSPHEKKSLSDEEIARRQLEMLSEVSSNIPAYAPQFESLISNNYDPSSSLQEELDFLSSFFPKGKSQVFLNKNTVAKGNENIYGILRLMKQFEFQKDRLEEIFTTRFLFQEADHSSTGESRNLLEYDPFYVAAAQIINSTMTEKLMSDLIAGVKDQMRSYISGLRSVYPFDSTLTNRALGNIPSRVHVDESVVFWMNDVEHDDRYERFPIPKSLKDLFYYTKNQKLVLPRLNAINIVFVLDPTTNNCASGLKDLIRVLSLPIPIRVGFSLAVESWGMESSRGEEFSLEDLGKTLLQERDYLLKQIEEYGDTPYDLEELSDSEGRSLLHGKTRLGAFALMAEVMLKIQGRRYHSDGSREEKVGVDTARMVASVGKVVDFFTLLDSETSENRNSRESAEEKRYNRDKKMLTLLKDFLQISEEMNPGWSEEETTDTLYNYYLRLRGGMGSFSFPYFPAVLMNGAIITDKRSLLPNIEAETEAIQNAIKEAQLFTSTAVEEKALPLFMRLFHASKRQRREFDETIPLTFWNLQTLPFSWIPPLLAFYEQSVFITGGLQSISETAAIPPSPVSGVFIFPRNPTIRTLDLLEKSLEAGNIVGKSFRFTFIPSLDCNFKNSSMRIERLLHSFLTDSYGKSDELLFSLQDMLLSNEGKDSSESSTTAKNTPISRMNLRKISLDKIRFQVVHRFLKLMINLANTLDLPFDSTMLSDPFLWSSLEEVVKNLSNSDDNLLFQYLSPMMQELKSREMHGDKGKHFSTSKPLLQEQRHCRIFNEYITHQAAVQGKLGRSLGLEPLLRKEDSAELSSPLSSHTHLVLVLHGNAVLLDRSFTPDDIAEVVYRATPLAEAVLQSLKRVPFSNISEPLGFTLLSSESPLAPSSLPGPSNWKSRMVGVTPNFLSARTALLSALLAQSADGVSDIFSPVEGFPKLESSSQVMYRFSSPIKGSVRHELLLVVNPTQRDGKKLLHLAKYFAHSPIAMDICIYMNPGPQCPSMDSFFNFVGSPKIEFEVQTGQVKAAAARFTGLPQDRPMGLTLVENPSWNVFPVRSPDYDLDNFMLSSVDENVSSFSVMYEIQSLVMSGKVQAPHRRDIPPLSKSYRALESPTGLSLSFTACYSEMPEAMSPTVKKDVREAMVISDSQAYFQVALVPGLWTVSINGLLSSDFYLSEIEERSTRKENEWWSSPSNDGAFKKNAKRYLRQRIPIIINSFHFTSTSLTYDRSWEHRTNIKEMLKQEYKRKNTELNNKKAIGNPEKKPSLNIFAVASGKMYEQFLRTMIQSVFRTSALSEQADVDLRGRILKFWLLENFLSPKFKTTIAKMASFYGFEIGFVTYSWPDWIEEPDDKMKKLWAYKILFLDAIFPLEVERILYLDADVISLTDLHELYNMDFQSGGVLQSPTNYPSNNERDSGLPSRRSIEESPTIALPRVCSGVDANLATKMHRFWEVHGGFWKNYLTSYSFHSSALFVVDLLRFRAMGHGNAYRDEFIDFIRNSQTTVSSGQEYLNLLQKKVPIYTLEDNWGWCEAWCTPISKKKAKILDVCTNPSARRSKIEAARLVYSDWDAMQIQLNDLFDSFENYTARKKEIIENSLTSTPDVASEIITDDL